MKNYDPVREYFSAHRQQIKHTADLMLSVKRTTDHPCWIVGHEKSDYHSFLKYCRGIRYLLRWHDIFAEKRVIDVGAGIGMAYHALRFCKPKEIIAVEPWVENSDFITRNYGYDSVLSHGWQEHDFQSDDVVLTREVTIDDFDAFTKKMKSAKVAHVILIDEFVNINDERIFLHDWTHDGSMVPGRFTYDRKIDRYLVPSIAHVRGMFYKNGYDLQDDMVYAGKSNNELFSWFNLHYKLRNGPMRMDDAEFRYAQPLIKSTANAKRRSIGR